MFSTRCSAVATRQSSASSSSSGRASAPTAARPRIRRAADCGHRDPLSRRGISCRHGRRVLLGRLPARVDTLGAAAQASPDEVGPDWWQRRETGDFLRGLFHEGTRPSSEEIAERSAIPSSRTRRSSRRTARRTTATARWRSGRRRRRRSRAAQLVSTRARHPDGEHHHPHPARGRRLRPAADQRLHGRGGARSPSRSACRSRCCGRAKTTCGTTTTGPAASTS